MSIANNSYLQQDRWVWWIGIPIFTLFIHHIGIGWIEIKSYITQHSYWYNLTYNIIIISISLFLLRTWLKWLDRRVPYRPNFARRILFQLLTSVIGLLTFIEIATFIYVKIWMKGDYWDHHLHTDIPFAIVLILITNLLYIGLYLMEENKTEPKSLDKPILPRRISVQIGTASFSLSPNEIALIISTNRLVKVTATNEKSYWSNQSLKELAIQLGDNQFYRANRQTLIHRQLIKGYRKLPNRKLELILTSSTITDEKIYISKAKASTFQTWLEKPVRFNP